MEAERMRRRTSSLRPSTAGMRTSHRLTPPLRLVPRGAPRRQPQRRQACALYLIRDVVPREREAHRLDVTWQRV